MCAAGLGICRLATLGAVGGKQPPRDLDARRFGLLLADQAARAIAVDFAELVAIDGGVERLRVLLARPQRPLMGATEPGARSP